MGRYQRLPVDSADAIARYTRWAVTGKVLQEQIDHLSTGGANAPDTWQAAKVVRAGSLWALPLHVTRGKNLAQSTFAAACEVVAPALIDAVMLRDLAGAVLRQC
eukprot:COSAG01_NODE_24337_length_782_cov_6.674963_2_plen_104_part_00